MDSFFVTENMAEIEGVGKTAVYGITMKDREGNCVTCVDISTLRSTAERFAELCRKNSVSSLHLFDVLEDYVAEL